MEISRAHPARLHSDAGWRRTAAPAQNAIETRDVAFLVAPVLAFCRASPRARRPLPLLKRQPTGGKCRRPQTREFVMTFKKFAMVAAGLLATCHLANATTVTRSVNFSVSNFSSSPVPGPAPTDPVLGSFDITLDDALNYSNNVAGITLHNLNIALGSALSFNYLSVNDQLTVGGLNQGAASISVSPDPTDDFYLVINHFLSDMPSIISFVYVQTAAGRQSFMATGQNSAVSVETPAAATPLPAALPLFAAGLAGIGLIVRTRKRKRAAVS
jgi:hypothetical protein